MFEVDPSRADRKVFDWGTGGETGAVFPVEFGFVRGDKKAWTQGHLTVGGFCNTSKVADLSRGEDGRPVALSGAGHTGTAANGAPTSCRPGGGALRR